MTVVPKQLRSERFEAFALKNEDSPEVQRLLEACADFCRLILGREPLPSDGQALYEMGPEAGRPPGDKLLLGIRTPGRPDLVGILDAFRNYPEQGIWYIGLLLFLPELRSSGLGRKVVDELATLAREQGAKEIQLNVVDQNEKAKHFWDAC